jgi:hypothetical protein
MIYCDSFEIDVTFFAEVTLIQQHTIGDSREEQRYENNRGGLLSA